MSKFIFCKFNNIESVEQFCELKEQNNLILLDFYTTWCGPCKILSPTLENEMHKYNNVLFAKIEADNPNLEQIVDKFKIKAFPTIVLMKNKEVKKVIVGNKPKEIFDAINSML